MRRGHNSQRAVADCTDHQYVRDGAETGRLTKRDPGEQDDRADDDDDPADLDSRVVREPLREHVPRREPEPRSNHEREREAEETKAEEQLHHARDEASGLPAHIALKRMRRTRSCPTR